MHLVGIILGWVIVFGYLALAAKYPVKLVFQKKIALMPQDSPTRKKYMAFMRMILTGHGYIGLFLVTIILLHFMIELTHVGFFLSGFVVALLALSQIFLGIYGTYVKGRRKGLWLSAHHLLAVLLLVAIIIHIITVIQLQLGPNHIS